MRTWLGVVILLLVTMGVGCDSTGLYGGCDVSCRQLFECGLNAPNAVPGCTNQCVTNLSEKSDACKEATAALGECGRNLTCDDFAADACSAESTAATNACNGTGTPDAGVDASTDGVATSFTVVVDRPTIQTELLRQEALVATVSSVGGFAGTLEVRIALGANGFPVAWPIAMNPRFVTVPANGSVSATFVIDVPSDAADLAVTAYVYADHVGTIASATSSITVDRRISIKWLDGTGTGTLHPAIGPNAMTIRAGTQIVWTNEDTIPHIVYGGEGIPHQLSTGGTGAPGTFYTATPTVNGRWYCHSHELGTNSRSVTVVP